MHLLSSLISFVLIELRYKKREANITNKKMFTAGLETTTLLSIIRHATDKIIGGYSMLSNCLFECSVCIETTVIVHREDPGG